MKSRNYSESEKFAAVERFLVGGESVATIAADTGISRSTLYAWIKSAQIEPVTLDFTLKNFRMLEAKVKRLEGIVEILQIANCTANAPLNEKLQALEELHGQYNVHILCDALKVPRGTFYNYIFRNKRDNTWYAKRREELRIRGFVRTPVVTVVTQVRVDPNDPAFENPSKPIGKFLTKEEADHQAKAYGHIMKEDAGRGYRRVVASPKPVEIVEQDAINSLVDANKIVICCGGGGIPVVLNGHHLKGASAVIDKDYASCLLAKELDADMLIILTAVEKVAVNFGKENEKWLDDMTVEEAQKYVEEGQFAPGSMLPKVQAAMDFASSKPERTAMITLLEKAKDGIQGKTGTKIHI